MDSSFSICLNPVGTRSESCISAIISECVHVWCARHLSSRFCSQVKLSCPVCRSPANVNRSLRARGIEMGTSVVANLDSSNEDSNEGRRLRMTFASQSCSAQSSRLQKEPENVEISDLSGFE